MSKEIAKIREYEINEQDDVIIISQENGGYGEDQIFLSKDQIPLFIKHIFKTLKVPTYEEYTGTLFIENEYGSHMANINANNIEDLLSEKTYFFESFIYDVDKDPYQKDNTELKDVKKRIVIDITGE